jgi:hypothetical protein
MALTTLSTATLVGNLAADAEIKTVDVGGSPTQVLEATIYVRRRRDRDSSFTVELSIWGRQFCLGSQGLSEESSLIAAYGSVEPSPYITSTSQEAAGGAANESSGSH